MIELNQQQKLHLYEQGWVVMPQAVSKNRIKSALKAINSSIGQYVDTIQMRVLGNQDLFPELRTDKRIVSLFTETGALALAESALGRGKVVLSPNVQIALRFPVLGDKPWPLDPHIDSFHPAKDGQPGRISPFTAIAGFFLNDIEDDWAGNFTVWPGTHRLFERYFRENKPDPELKCGIPPVELPQPIQLKVKAGDMFFAHYQLAHTASSNVSDAIRYAVYFRMNHVNQPKISPEVLGDIWRYWDGMRDCDMDSSSRSSLSFQR